MRNRLKYLLPIFLFCLPWQTRLIFGQELIVGHSFAFGVLSFYASEFILLIIALFYLFDYGLRNVMSKIKERRELIFILLLLCSIFVFVAINKVVAINHIMHLFFAIILFLLLVNRRTDYLLCLRAFVIGLLIPVLLGIFQLVYGWSPASTLLGLATRNANTLGDAVIILGNGTRILRAYGSFSHPNIFAGYLVFGILFCWYLSGGFKKIIKNKWQITELVILLLGLLISYSQSAWLGILLVIFFSFILFSNKWQDISLLIKNRIVFLSLILIFIFNIFGIFLLKDLGVNNISVVERAIQYQEWPKIINHSWFIGIGIENYTYAIEAFDSTRAWWQYQPIHNIFLLIFSELGIIGLLFFIGVIILLVLNILKRDDKMALFVLFAFFTIALLDHYFWSGWSGLALLAIIFSFMFNKNLIKNLDN